MARAAWYGSGVVATSQQRPEIAALKVLVVDDDPDVCEYLHDFLTSEGYTVTVEHDPTQALTTLRGDEFHLAVLDLMMPKLSGIDLLAQIREIDDDIAIIILTGYPSLETATSSIERDVSAYIRKPFTVDDFREAITRIAKKKGLILRREDELQRDDRALDPRAAQGPRPDAQADVATDQAVGVAAVADRARRVERQRVVAVEGRDRARRAADRAVRHVLIDELLAWVRAAGARCDGLTVGAVPTGRGMVATRAFAAGEVVATPAAGAARHPRARAGVVGRPPAARRRRRAVVEPARAVRGVAVRRGAAPGVGLRAVPARRCRRRTTASRLAASAEERALLRGTLTGDRLALLEHDLAVMRATTPQATARVRLLARRRARDHFTRARLMRSARGRSRSRSTGWPPTRWCRWPT
jgi:DNA-binding response OmpR family regulator